MKTGIFGKMNKDLKKKVEYAKMSNHPALAAAERSNRSYQIREQIGSIRSTMTSGFGTSSKTSKKDKGKKNKKEKK